MHERLIKKIICDAGMLREEGAKGENLLILLYLLIKRERERERERELITSSNKTIKCRQCVCDHMQTTKWTTSKNLPFKKSTKT